MRIVAAREGEFLLSEIMQSGNFGKQDNRLGDASASKAGKLSAVSRRTLHLASRYTGEALSAPFYYARYYHLHEEYLASLKK